VIDRGAQEAWANLTKSLRPFVARRTACDADADDVLQDVFVRIQTGLPALRDEDRFGPWVYRIARNAIADHRRRARRSVAVAETDAEAADERADAGSTAEEELASYIAPFVALLPSPYREAITLTELESLPHALAAEMLGISLTAMKSRVRRGREKLRKTLEACCKIEVDARGRVIDCVPRKDGLIPNCACTTDPRRTR
jgi:RNA polymerase sigma-70 factor (ECF subfamily)